MAVQWALLICGFNTLDLTRCGCQAPVWRVSRTSWVQLEVLFRSLQAFWAMGWLCKTSTCLRRPQEHFREVLSGFQQTGRMKQKEFLVSDGYELVPRLMTQPCLDATLTMHWCWYNDRHILISSRQYQASVAILVTLVQLILLMLTAFMENPTQPVIHEVA